MKKSLQISLLRSLGAVSGTSTYYTVFQPIDSFLSYMFQIAWTSSPLANVSLEISADPIPDLQYNMSSGSRPQPVNFDIISDSLISTASKNILTYDVIGTAGSWVRLKWENISGSGTITSVNFIGKGSMV